MLHCAQEVGMPGKHKDKAAEMIKKMKSQQQKQAFDRKKSDSAAVTKKRKSTYSRGKAKY